jgi:serine-type D-Ala-D-Ala carboxypeptidase (penicillin-binding protein 5/6)
MIKESGSPPAAGMRVTAPGSGKRGTVSERLRTGGRLTAGAVAAVAAVVTLLGPVTGPAAQAAVATPSGRPAAVTAVGQAPAGVQSHWAELANAATGADLWSRSSVLKRPIGSIAKVMTAYVVLTTPGLNLNRVITVPDGIVGYDEEFDASTAGLVPGEKLTTRQLLYAMMLPSGCDAAYTLAEAYGPGLTGFIARMNATARKLGLAKTRFSDFSGLPDPTEYSTYSTAHDLVALGRAALKNKTFAAIAGTREYKVAAGHGHLAHTWKNLNPLLGTFPGATGIKTGYTSAAGQCLLFAAKRGSTTLIGVVLDSSGVDSASLAAAASDATAMLDWGFSR